MLKNVRYAGVVVGIRFEPRGKHIVPVLARNVDILGARFVVTEVDRGQLKLGHRLCALHGEAVQLVAWAWELVEGGGIATAVAAEEDGGLLRGEEAGERGATAEHCGRWWWWWRWWRWKRRGGVEVRGGER